MLKTVFHSGDDLEDDFMIGDKKNSKNAVADSNSGPATADGEVEKDVHVKPNKKQVPSSNFFLDDQIILYASPSI